MYNKAKQYTLSTPLLRRIIGVFFLLAGIITLVTPLTPGALFLTVVGLELLGFEILFIEKLKQRYLRRPSKRLPD